ncbi:MAG: lysophospholipid acyltransferase family protein [Roseibacillus sp.]
MAASYKWTKRLSWRLEYVGYLFMEAIFRLAPLSLIDRAGSAIGFLFFYLSRNYRQLAIRNLRIAFGEEKSSSEIRLLARRTCQRTIANFLGTLKTTILPTEDVSKHVALQGYEPLQKILASGQGAILVLGHMGNWEILNRLHQFLPKGVAAGGIYQPLKNPLVDRLLLERREQDGSKLFNKRDGFHAPASFVKNGGLLIVVADQKVGRGGIAIPFFNRLSSLSPLPALLARKADAPVVAAGIETLTPGKWQMVFQPLGTRPDTPKIVSALETLIRRSPADYLWLHDRWRLAGKYPLSMKSKKTKTPHAQTKPLRMLIVTTRTPDHTLAEKLQEHRKASDFDLSIEFLWIHSHQTTEGETPPYIHHTIAPTSEQLASQILSIDWLATHPIEILLVDTPSPEIERALRHSTIPEVRINKNQLPTIDFVLSLFKSAPLETSAAPQPSSLPTPPDNPS